MKKYHRWLILPALIALVGAGLLYFGIITFETSLPIDSIALTVGAVAGMVLMFALGIEGRGVVQSWEMPEPEDPPSADYVIQPKPLQDALDSAEEAEQFTRRATERVLIDIDVEDARDDT
jgi:hypothetical protein